MEILAAAVIVVPLLVLMVYVLVRNRKQHVKVEDRSGALPVLLMLDLSIVGVGLMVEENHSARLMLDLSLSLMPISFLSLSIFKLTNIRRFLLLTCAGSMLLLGSHLSCIFGLFPPAPPSRLVRSAVLVECVLAAFVIYGLCSRVLDIGLVMKSGSVWSVVNFFSDFVYVLFICLSGVMALLVSDMVGRYRGVHLYLTDLSMMCSIAAMAIRIVRNSPFLMMSGQERLIIESIKVSRIELPDDSAKDNDMYRMIYGRLTDYFEKEKPFLRSELTINDIVKVIYSNKLYVSRAISLCTGRNFRQFVNYYRVRYSIDLFRENPQLKVVELSHASGFNSMASFNTAFRLFMNESPSEWCRQEKSRMMRRRPLADK
ncbi:MAG: helix-turn-helix domain-containing protein [Candidatus Cryptobacteroides sp.]